MKKDVFSLKAWHFCLLFLCLLVLIFVWDTVEYRNSPEEFDSCFVEVDRIPANEAGNDFYCILFHDGESDLNRKMEYNFSEYAFSHLPDAHLYKVNIAANRQLISDYRISGVPSLLVFRDGEEADRIMGVVSTSTIQRIFNRINP